MTILIHKLKTASNTVIPVRTIWFYKLQSDILREFQKKKCACPYPNKSFVDSTECVPQCNVTNDSKISFLRPHRQKLSILYKCAKKGK